MCHGNEEWSKIWREIDLSVKNWHEEFDEFWSEDSKISKICPLMGRFWPKYKIFELKKYTRLMFNDTPDWYKIWRKTDLCFKKRHDEFGKFSPEHLKVSKLRFWWDAFIQSRRCMSLKFSRKLCVMKRRSVTKFEGELNCQFKIDTRNLTNFDPSTR